MASSSPILGSTLNRWASTRRGPSRPARSPVASHSRSIASAAAQRAAADGLARPVRVHRAAVGGELVVGDQHQVDAVEVGRQVEPAGGVEDLGLDTGQDPRPRLAPEARATAAVNSRQPAGVPPDVVDQAEGAQARLACGRARSPPSVLAPSENVEWT